MMLFALAAACGSSSENSSLVELSALDGSRLDLGWSGRGQALLFPPGLLFVAHTRRCLETGQGQQCEIEGVTASGEPFGPPIPMTDPPVPICLVASSARSITGTVNRDSGCILLQAPLRWEAFLKLPSDEFPCPICIGDKEARDDKQEGLCSGGSRDGKPCDAAGTLVPSAMTSLDCPPLPSRLAGSWTATFLLASTTLELLRNEACDGDFTGATGECLCNREAFPEQCDPTIIDYRCSKEPSRTCSPGTGSAQCEFVSPGSGTCAARPRPCFSRAIFYRSGRCDTGEPLLVGFSCVSATGSGPLDTLTGLPAPALLKLKTRLVFK